MKQNKPKDKFWRLYTSIVALIVLVVAGVTIFFFMTQVSYGGVSPEVLGAYDESLEEYEFVEVPQFYKDSLSKGLDNWSWDANVDFLAPSPQKGGTDKSIKTYFIKENAGLMIHAPHFDTSEYYSIKLSIYLGENFAVNDKDPKIFIEINDQNGKEIGLQLLSWYAPDKKLEKGKWYELLIPLENLNALDSKITDISIVSSATGEIFVDDIYFSKQYNYVQKWQEEIAALDPFETAPKVSLPYESNFYSKHDDWKAFNGKLKVEYSKMRLETGADSNYGIFLLKGSKEWQDYRYTVSIDWAMGDSVNLLARYSDNNYFSCSFFDDGQNVTLNQSQDGKIVELESAPNFTRYRDYSWTKVKTLGIEVKGDKVSCLTNGNVKVSRNAKLSYPVMGGVGIELWSPEKNKNSMSISQILVEPLQ